MHCSVLVTSASNIGIVCNRKQAFDQSGNFQPAVGMCLAVTCAKMMSHSCSFIHYKRLHFLWQISYHASYFEQVTCIFNFSHLKDDVRLSFLLKIILALKWLIFLEATIYQTVGAGRENYPQTLWCFTRTLLLLWELVAVVVTCFVCINFVVWFFSYIL